MADNLSRSRRSQVMRSIKSTDSSLERAVRARLHKHGLRFRKHSRLPGKPDVVFPTARLVVFIDSCFWHGCQEHVRMPRSNTEYWTTKIARNKRRDEYVNNEYASTHWKVMRFWEHEITEDIDICVRRIASLVLKRRPKFSRRVSVE